MGKKHKAEKRKAEKQRTSDPTGHSKDKAAHAKKVKRAERLERVETDYETSLRGALFSLERAQGQAREAFDVAFARLEHKAAGRLEKIVSDARDEASAVTAALHQVLEESQETSQTTLGAIDANRAQVQKRLANFLDQIAADRAAMKQARAATDGVARDLGSVAEKLEARGREQIARLAEEGEVAIAGVHAELTHRLEVVSARVGEQAIALDRDTERMQTLVTELDSRHAEIQETFSHFDQASARLAEQAAGVERDADRVRRIIGETNGHRVALEEARVRAETIAADLEGRGRERLEEADRRGQDASNQLDVLAQQLRDQVRAQFISDTDWLRQQTAEVDAEIARIGAESAERILASQATVVDQVHLAGDEASTRVADALATVEADARSGHEEARARVEAALAQVEVHAASALGRLDEQVDAAVENAQRAAARVADAEAAALHAASVFAQAEADARTLQETAQLWIETALTTIEDQSAESLRQVSARVDALTTDAQRAHEVVAQAESAARHALEVFGGVEQETAALQGAAQARIEAALATVDDAAAKAQGVQAHLVDADEVVETIRGFATLAEEIMEQLADDADEARRIVDSVYTQSTDEAAPTYPDLDDSDAVVSAELLQTDAPVEPDVQVEPAAESEPFAEFELTPTDARYEPLAGVDAYNTYEAVLDQPPSDPTPIADYEAVASSEFAPVDSPDGYFQWTPEAVAEDAAPDIEAPYEVDFFSRIAADLRNDPNPDQFPGVTLPDATTVDPGHHEPTAGGGDGSSGPLLPVVAAYLVNPADLSGSEPVHPVALLEVAPDVSEPAESTANETSPELAPTGPVSVIASLAAMAECIEHLGLAETERFVRMEITHSPSESDDKSQLRLATYDTEGWWLHADITVYADRPVEASTLVELGELREAVTTLDRFVGASEVSVVIGDHVTIGNHLLLTRDTDEVPALPHDRRRVERVDLQEANRSGLVLETQLGRLFVSPELLTHLRRYQAASADLVTLDGIPCLSVPVVTTSADVSATIVARLHELGENDAPEVAERRNTIGNEVSQLVNALSATTTPQELERILKVGVGYVRRRTAAHPLLPEEVIHNLIREGTEAMRAAAASNVSISDAAVQLALVDQSPVVRSAVASNPAIGDANLELLAADPDPQVRARAASNETASVELLERLAEDPDSSVRAAVAAHPAVPLETLRLLAQDPDPSVCAAVGGNIACPPDILSELVSIVPDTVLANPSTSPALLAAGSVVDSPRLRATVASNPATPAKRLRKLAGDNDPQVLRAVAEHPDTPPRSRRRARRQLDERRGTSQS